jgi:hypothetical protein
MIQYLETGLRLAQNVAAESLKQGIQIGRREQAAAVADLVDELFGAVTYELALGRNPLWLDNARAILAKHSPSPVMLIDENPAKRDQLRADARRVRDEEKGEKW